MDLHFTVTGVSCSRIRPLSCLSSTAGPWVWVGRVDGWLAEVESSGRGRVCSAESNVSPRYENFFISEDTQTSEDGVGVGWWARGLEGGVCKHTAPTAPLTSFSRLDDLFLATDSHKSPRRPCSVTHHHNRTVCGGRFALSPPQPAWQNIPGNAGICERALGQGGGSTLVNNWAIHLPFPNMANANKQTPIHPHVTVLRSSGQSAYDVKHLSGTLTGRSWPLTCCGFLVRVA